MSSNIAAPSATASTSVVPIGRNKPLPILPPSQLNLDMGQLRKSETVRVRRDDRAPSKRQRFHSCTSTQALDIFSPRFEMEEDESYTTSSTRLSKVASQRTNRSIGGRMRSMPSLISLTSQIYSDTPGLSPTSSEFSLDSTTLVSPTDSEFSIFSPPTTNSPWAPKRIVSDAVGVKTDRQIVVRIA